ncbi:1712_t:CDS:2, partial [Ambispora leptoticha]
SLSSTKIEKTEEKISNIRTLTEKPSRQKVSKRHESHPYKGASTPSHGKNSLKNEKKVNTPIFDVLDNLLFNQTSNDNNDDSLYFDLNLPQFDNLNNQDVDISVQNSNLPQFDNLNNQDVDISVQNSSAQQFENIDDLLGYSILQDNLSANIPNEINRYF